MSIRELFTGNSDEYQINVKLNKMLRKLINENDYSDLSYKIPYQIIEPLVDIILEYKHKNDTIARLQQLDIGSLLYYDVMKYIR
jgi:hypothetical protein